MEAVIYATAGAVVAMLATKTYYRANIQNPPPTWDRIVAALGESLNLANQRISILENRVEHLHAEHMECQKANAVLMSKVEYLEADRKG